MPTATDFHSHAVLTSVGSSFHWVMKYSLNRANLSRNVSTTTSTQLSKMSLHLPDNIAPFRLPGLNLALWDHLDIILYNLAGKYRPRYEGEKMLVGLVDVYLDPSKAEKFLWRYRERGTLRVDSET